MGAFVVASGLVQLAGASRPGFRIEFPLGKGIVLVRVTSDG
jgi:hypothetical protein